MPVFVLKGVNSKGNIAADFNREWQNLIVKNYAVTHATKITETKAGIVSFAFNNGTSMACLSPLLAMAEQPVLLH